MIYVVTRSYSRYLDHCKDRGISSLNDAVYAGRNVTLRGRVFQEGDEVHLLEGHDEMPEWPDIQYAIGAMTAVSRHAPKVIHVKQYDVPRPGEDLEAWLAR